MSSSRVTSEDLAIGRDALIEAASSRLTNLPIPDSHRQYQIQQAEQQILTARRMDNFIDEAREIPESEGGVESRSRQLDQLENLLETAKQANGRPNSL